MITLRQSSFAKPTDGHQWNFEKAPDPSSRVQLLTVTGQRVCGKWEGALGGTYVAWAPMKEQPQEEILKEAVALIQDLMYSSWDMDFIAGKYDSDDEDENSLRNRVSKLFEKITTEV